MGTQCDVIEAFKQIKHMLKWELARLAHSSIESTAAPDFTTYLLQPPAAPI